MPTLGVKGRPRKADSIKKQQGTLKSNRVNKNAPAFGIEPVPDPPAYLTKWGIAEWNRLADQLHRQGLLQKTDWSMLGAACLEWQCYVQHREEQQDVGSYYKIPGKFGDSVQPHPLHYNGNNHLKNYVAICREFGFTPAARSKISVPQDLNKKQSPISSVLKKTG
jgi:P27 family predicted phage terminase small subunit